MGAISVADDVCSARLPGWTLWNRQGNAGREIRFADESAQIFRPRGTPFNTHPPPCPVPRVADYSSCKKLPRGGSLDDTKRGALPTWTREGVYWAIYCVWAMKGLHGFPSCLEGCRMDVETLSRMIPNNIHSSTLAGLNRWTSEPTRQIRVLRTFWVFIYFFFAICCYGADAWLLQVCGVYLLFKWSAAFEYLAQYSSLGIFLKKTFTRGNKFLRWFKGFC